MTPCFHLIFFFIDLFEAGYVDVETIPLASEGSSSAVRKQINIKSASLIGEIVQPSDNDVEVIPAKASSPEEQRRIIDAILQDLQSNFTGKYQDMLKYEFESFAINLS
jgi:hypothetical protein